MSIETLTTAARAAGFAMAPTDDLPVDLKRPAIDVAARSSEQPKAVVTTRPATSFGSEWWSFWKTA